MTKKTILVIGGTKQMGVHLVEELLAKSYDVTVANRGKSGDAFGNRVKRIVFDRSSEASVANAFSGKYFDVIIDTIAYSGNSVKMIFKYIKTRKYIQFSSISAYAKLDLLQKENDFTPSEFKNSDFVKEMSYLTAGDANYQIGKRNAEKAALEVFPDSVIIRIPSVGGKDALSTTLKQYADAIGTLKTLNLARYKYSWKFAITHTSEPGRFAVHAIENDLSGIYNVASDSYFTNEMIVRYLEVKLGITANINWGDVNDCFHADFPEHTLNTEKAKATGFKFYKIDDWLWDTLDYFASPYIKKHTPDLTTNIANVIYRQIAAAKYGGDLFDYFKDNGIDAYDVCLENAAIKFIPSLLNCMGKLPDNFYSLEDEEITINDHVRNTKFLVKPLKSLTVGKPRKSMVIFSNWNSELLKKLAALNYMVTHYTSLVDYSLYKSVVIENCGKYLNQKGIKCLFTRFPQANSVKNQSKLERFLGNNSIYGYHNESIKYGLDNEDIVSTKQMTFNVIRGIKRLADIESEHTNVINGFRHTTDVPNHTLKRIWIFGSSVVFGVFADDKHTIASSLQRELNESFSDGEGYVVVNAPNYSGNDVGVVYPYIKSLPISKGDICIFNMEFPLKLLEMNKEIINMSRYFDRPHEYGEIFVDINHMTGKGYCAQGKVLFDILNEKKYFDCYATIDG